MFCICSRIFSISVFNSIALSEILTSLDFDNCEFELAENGKKFLNDFEWIDLYDVCLNDFEFDDFCDSYNETFVTFLK